MENNTLKQHLTTPSTTAKIMFRSLSLSGEVWTPAKDKPSNYYVSNMGRILTTNWRNKNKTRVMKPALDACGYLRTVVGGKTTKNIVADIKRGKTWGYLQVKKPTV